MSTEPDKEFNSASSYCSVVVSEKNLQELLFNSVRVFN